MNIQKKASEKSTESKIETGFHARNCNYRTKTTAFTETKIGKKSIPNKMCALTQTHLPNVGFGNIGFGSLVVKNSYLSDRETEQQRQTVDM